VCVIDLALPVLVQNAALLLAVAVVFDLVSSRVTIDRARIEQALSGLLLGVIGVSIMLSPWHFASGIFFDTRTVLLVIAGVFFGPMPTAITLAMMIAFRLTQPGAASITGIAGMILAAALGVGWRYRRRLAEDLSFRHLLLFGLAAHVLILGQTTLLMFLTLPQAVAATAIGQLWLPLLTVYPVATALLGVLLVVRLRARRLTDANARLRAEVETQLEEVRASRARIVEAGNDERRRVERDLHDGAQQRLVSLSLAIRLAQSHAEAAGDTTLNESLGRAADEAAAALEELRELAHGIHPLILTEGGLGEAVESLADRAALPVTVDVGPERYPSQVEVAAYFVVSEALANVAKYASATQAGVRVTRRADHVAVEVNDNGVGGADLQRGSGLRGLADRLAALEGTLSVVSPPGGGTTVSASIPLGQAAAASV
jgi:signal transduction histidine kinase